MAENPSTVPRAPLEGPSPESPRLASISAGAAQETLAGRTTSDDAPPYIDPDTTLPPDDKIKRWWRSALAAAVASALNPKTASAATKHQKRGGHSSEAPLPPEDGYVAVDMEVCCALQFPPRSQATQRPDLVAEARSRRLVVWLTLEWIELLRGGVIDWSFGQLLDCLNGSFG